MNEPTVKGYIKELGYLQSMAHGDKYAAVLKVSWDRNAAEDTPINGPLVIRAEARTKTKEEAYAAKERLLALVQKARTV